MFFFRFRSHESLGDSFSLSYSISCLIAGVGSSGSREKQVQGAGQGQAVLSGEYSRDMLGSNMNVKQSGGLESWDTAGTTKSLGIAA